MRNPRVNTTPQEMIASSTNRKRVGACLLLKGNWSSAYPASTQAAKLTIFAAGVMPVNPSIKGWTWLIRKAPASQASCANPNISHGRLIGSGIPGIEIKINKAAVAEAVRIAKFSANIRAGTSGGMTARIRMYMRTKIRDSKRIPLRRMGCGKSFANNGPKFGSLQYAAPKWNYNNFRKLQDIAE